MNSWQKSISAFLAWCSPALPFLWLGIMVELNALGAEEKKSDESVADHSKAEPDLHLMVDYLPTALYEKEPLTACFRVENESSSKRSVEIIAEVRDEAGKMIGSHIEKLELPAKGSGTYQRDHSIEGASRVTFWWQGSKDRMDGPRVRILRDTDPWPETIIRDRRLVEKETNEVVVPAVKRRKSDDERNWAPVRWIMGKKPGKSKHPIKSALLCVPGILGEMRGASSKEKGEVPVDFKDLVPLGPAEKGLLRILGPYRFEGAAPVLSAIGDVLGTMPKEVPDRVILMLPSDDLDVSTDPRTYEIVMDAWFLRLRTLLVKEIVVFPPFRYGITKNRQELLWAAVQDAAQVHKVLVVQVNELLDEKLWRVNPEEKGVYGKRPNAAGRAKIAEMLVELLR